MRIKKVHSLNVLMSTLYLLLFIKLCKGCIDTIYNNNDTNIECSDGSCIYDIKKYCNNNCNINVNIGNNVNAVNISICLLCDSNTLCAVGITSQHIRNTSTCSTSNENCMIPVSFKCLDNNCEYSNDTNCECLLQSNGIYTYDEPSISSTVNTTVKPTYYCN